MWRKDCSGGFLWGEVGVRGEAFWEGRVGGALEKSADDFTGIFADRWFLGGAMFGGCEGRMLCAALVCAGRAEGRKVGWGVFFAVLDAALSYLFVNKGFMMPSGFRLFTIFYAVFRGGVWEVRFAKYRWCILSFF